MADGRAHTVPEVVRALDSAVLAWPPARHVREMREKLLAAIKAPR